MTILQVDPTTTGRNANGGAGDGAVGGEVATTTNSGVGETAAGVDKITIQLDPSVTYGKNANGGEDGAGGTVSGEVSTTIANTTPVKRDADTTDGGVSGEMTTVPPVDPMELADALMNLASENKNAPTTGDDEITMEVDPTTEATNTVGMNTTSGDDGASPTGDEMTMEVDPSEAANAIPKTSTDNVSPTDVEMALEADPTPTEPVEAVKENVFDTINTTGGKTTMEVDPTSTTGPVKTVTENVSDATNTTRGDEMAMEVDPIPSEAVDDVSDNAVTTAVDGGNAPGRRKLVDI